MRHHFSITLSVPRQVTSGWSELLHNHTNPFQIQFLPRSRLPGPFEGGFEVFDPSTRSTSCRGPGSGSSRAKRVEGRRFLGRERRDRRGCRILRGFRLEAKRLSRLALSRLKNQRVPFLHPLTPLPSFLRRLKSRPARQLLWTQILRQHRVG